MIGERYAALLRVFQHALHDGSTLVRSQVCKTTLKEIAARFFLWGDALGLPEAHLELQHFLLLQSRVERHLLTMGDLIIHVFRPGFESFAVNELLLNASDTVAESPPTGNSSTGSFSIRSLSTAETDISSSFATHNDENVELQYDDHEMDGLLEEIDLLISCLAELSPSIQRCMEDDDAGIKVSRIVPDSLETHPQIQKTFRILEEKYPKASRELLKRLYMARTRDASQARADFGLCTFNDCWAKYMVFEGAQWAHHEFSQHRFNRAWTCHICQHVDVDELAWLRHLSAAHLLDLKGAQMPLASQIACQVHSRPVEQEMCHFCGKYPAGIREDFEKHVGAHFHDAFELIDRNALSSERMVPHSHMEEETDILSENSAPSVGTSLDTPVPIDTLLDTDPQSFISANPAGRKHPPRLPPAKAVEFECGECMDSPVMKLKETSHCVLCGREFDAYSTFYDRRGRRILI